MPADASTSAGSLPCLASQRRAKPCRAIPSRALPRRYFRVMSNIDDLNKKPCLALLRPAPPSQAAPCLAEPRPARPCNVPSSVTSVNPIKGVDSFEVYGSMRLHFNYSGGRFKPYRKKYRPTLVTES